MPLCTYEILIAGLNGCRLVPHRVQANAIINIERNTGIHNHLNALFTSEIERIRITYPSEDIRSHFTSRSWVPSGPHGVEHLLHGLSDQCGAQTSVPHFCTSAGFAEASHRLISTSSNVLRLLQVTLLDWEPPPQLAEHGVKSV